MAQSSNPAGIDNASAAAIAAHRFGLGEPSLAAIPGNPAAWLMAQIGPADPQRGDNLASLGDGIKRYAEFLFKQRSAAGIASMAATTSTAAVAATAAMAASSPADNRSGEQQFGEHFRQLVQSDVRAHLATAIVTQRPFAERLALFWANHFTVSMAKASARGLVGAFEREAIRPFIAGSFETLLKSAVKHGSMLRYLDNELSAGPNSRLVQQRARRARDTGDSSPRITGLNENLAREVLELHTLGAASKAYTQRDVTNFAAVLTGWRVPLRPADYATAVASEINARFDSAWHEPGEKQLLGKTYPEGAAALDAVLHDLARHPATARFVALKLARHFVADEPPPALVDRLAAAFSSSSGDLPSLYRALIDAPEAWAPAPAKLKTPEEFASSTFRLLGLGEQPLARNADASIAMMGQRLQAAPSPAGWPDRAEEWLSPDAVWKRVEWATRIAERAGRGTDARLLARAAFGPRLSEATATQIERAADGPQALALLLLSPEFQRR